MKNLAYYLLLPFIYLLLLIPFPFFYALSDLTYFILFRVTGYRKKVVLQNLRNAFPEKSEAELHQISRKFYHYLCDLFLETFKTLTMSRATALRHCSISPEAQQLFEKYEKENKSLIIVMGHFGNWEWGGNAFSLQCRQQLYVIYHPLSHELFNSMLYKMRSRFGTKLISMKDTFKEMVKNKSELNATAFIADQTPGPENAYWTTFLKQDTPVFWGTEKIARKMNYPIVYVSIQRIKRGYYKLNAKTLFETPKDTAEGEISEAHTRILEKDILHSPETWLWSHRRWKHQRPTL
jgi:KDO2-lipid IV(A) lauroyltransferase